MARPCTVCEHRKRTDIDLALVSETHRVVSKRFGLSESSVYRHKIEHLAAAMASSSHLLASSSGTSEVTEIASADRLVDRVESVRLRAIALLDDLERNPSEDGPDYKAAASLLREVRGCIELQAKLLGELQTNSANTLRSPYFIQAARIVLAAVAEFPGAAEAALAALKVEALKRRGS